MKLNIKFISLLLIFCLISISVVSAAEDIENVSIAEEDVAEINDNDLIQVDDENNEKTFTDLNVQIKKATEGDIITLDSNYSYNDNFNYVYGIKIEKSLTIDGAGNKIDGKNTARIFQISADNVILKNLIVANGYYNTVGGAIRCDANGLVIDNCTFINNNANISNGGAVFINGDNSQIKNSIFTGNTAKNSGGAIRVDGSGTLIEDNQFNSNKAATAGGGAICLLGNNANTIKNNKFSDNIAGRDGGAIDLELGVGNLVELNTFTSNIALFGGAIAIYGGEFNFLNNKFNKNHAEIGGAIRVNNTIKEGVSTIANNEISDNYANSTGGALYLVGNYINVSNNRFTNNKALTYGGGTINVHNSNYSYIISNVIDGSGTKENGGSIVITGNNAEIISNNISNSNSGKSAGAIYLVGDSAKIDNNNFENNNANDSSGVLRLDSEKSTVSNNKFNNNKAVTSGGVSFITGNSNTITFNEFTSNNADVGGALRVEGDNNVINGNYFEKNTAEMGPTMYLHGDSNKFNKNTVIDSTEKEALKTYGTNDLTNNYYINKEGKVGTTLSTSGLTMKYNTGKYLTVTLKDNNDNVLANKKVYIKINGKTYEKTTNSKGQATLKIILAPNTYTTNINFKGDGNYTKSSTTAKVIVKKVAPKLTAPKKTFKVRKTKKLTATLKNNKGKILKGKKITFKINGKKYTAKTNKKGVATVKVKLTKRAKYKAVVSYAGDKYYSSIKKVTYVRVK